MKLQLNLITPDYSTLKKSKENLNDVGHFGTAGASETNWWAANKTKQKVSLSTQDLIHCDTGNTGCNAGWFKSAFK